MNKYFSVNKHFSAVKSYVSLKPFLNGLSIFLGILFLGLMSCSTATDSTSSSPTEDKTPDTTPPTVTIHSENLIGGEFASLSFIFSEKVSNFTSDDIQLLINGVNLDKGNFVTNSLTNYSLDIIPITNGTLEVSIPANSFYDLSGNKNTDSFSISFSVEDKTPPTVTISTNKFLKKDIPGTITFTFSEKVTSFIPDDIQLLINGINAEKGRFLTNSQKSYSLEITPTTNGNLTISIPANSFYDLSRNQNTDSFSTNFSVRENIPPTLTISTNKSLEKDIPGTITFTFSEKVSSFIPDDIQILINGVGVAKGSFVTNSQKTYSLEITPKVTGNLTISIPANSFYDLSDNQNTDNFSTNFSVEDKTPPTVNIYSETPIKGKSAYLTFIFSEKVTNFTPDDIQILINGVGVAKGSFVTNSQKTYSLEITPKVTGNLTITVPTNSFYDLSANQNNKPYSNSFTVHPVGTTTHTISFKLNGGSFISPQITNLKVVDNTAIEETRLGGILSYPPTGPQSNIQAVTRDIFDWRTNNGTKYDFSTLVNSDLTLEVVWRNSCGKVETFHPANKSELQNYVNAAYVANSTTNLNHIDTSAITDMNNLFTDKNRFNGKIDCWNTANVTNMNNMFNNASAFNQDLNTWNVANVTNMSSMFYNASAFNQDLNTWNVANVTNMSSMFYNASAFNQDISSWNVSNANNMSWMFYNASAFNQDIGSWDVANVTTMRAMLVGASAFNQDIGSWDVANVTTMSWIFYRAANFNQDISSWNVASVTNMSWMFFSAIAFNQDIGSWDVGNATDMSSMFQSATAFNQDISSWSVSNVTDMSYMFYNASAFDQNLSSWSVSNVTTYTDMFNGSAMESEKSKHPNFSSQ